MMYIGVDVDGTIVDHNNNGTLGTPVPEAIRWMKEWIKLEAKLILFTLRVDFGKEFGRPV